jgi:hypothetical protein
MGIGNNNLFDVTVLSRVLSREFRLAGQDILYHAFLFIELREDDPVPDGNRIRV